LINHTKNGYIFFGLNNSWHDFFFRIINPYLYSIKPLRKLFQFSCLALAASAVIFKLVLRTNYKQKQMSISLNCSFSISLLHFKKKTKRVPMSQDYCTLSFQKLMLVQTPVQHKLSNSNIGFDHGLTWQGKRRRGLIWIIGC